MTMIFRSACTSKQNVLHGSVQCMLVLLHGTAEILRSVNLLSTAYTRSVVQCTVANHHVKLNWPSWNLQRPHTEIHDLSTESIKY